MRSCSTILSTFALSAVLGSTGCLPQDTRPPPGKIELTATNAGAFSLNSPTTTTIDGWTVDLDRFLLSIGNAELGGSDCDFYSEARYRRILDLERSEPQRVCLLYALGHCDIGFVIRDPGNDRVLGAGVTAGEETFMRTPVPDDYTQDVNGGLGAGVSVFVEGTAHRGAVQKHFAWSFRRRFEYANCTLPSGSALARGVDLVSEHSDRIDIGIHGEALFLDSLGPDGALRFDAVASADSVAGNDDGEVTLPELSLVPLAQAYPNAIASGTDAGVDAGAWSTLEDFVYLGLVPRLARFGGTGSCDVSISDSDQRGR